ncbi:hypothetical protein LY78DRAFT_377567 [Colletotrichum sublineola]|nr:hypothetical protein LY78DRAFT_377567 [Colletotrichum sublineola]
MLSLAYPIGRLLHSAPGNLQSINPHCPVCHLLPCLIAADAGNKRRLAKSFVHVIRLGAADLALRNATHRTTPHCTTHCAGFLVKQGFNGPAAFPPHPIQSTYLTTARLKLTPTFLLYFLSDSLPFSRLGALLLVSNSVCRVPCPCMSHNHSPTHTAHQAKAQHRAEPSRRRGRRKPHHALSTTFHEPDLHRPPPHILNHRHTHHQHSRSVTLSTSR